MGKGIFDLYDKSGYDSPFSKGWTDDNILLKKTAIVPFVILKSPIPNEIELNKITQFDFVFIGSTYSDYYDIELKDNSSELKSDKNKWRVQNGTVFTVGLEIKKKKKYYLLFSINSQFASRIELNLFECFCNREFEENEFRDLVISLRKMNKYSDKLAEELFDMSSSEKLINPTWNKFQENLNGTFSKYNISNCIHKIHFIAQTYHESFHYRRPYENLTQVNENYRGGVAFQGRGIKQITHDDNYLVYYDHIMGTTYFEDYYKNYHKPNEGVTEYMNRVSNANFGTKLLEELKIFAKRLSTELIFTCDSAGWFWKTNNLNLVAEIDDVKKLTKIINGGYNGLDDRIKYTDQLKIIMNFSECKLVKKN